MGRAEAGTPKAIANAIKAKGVCPVMLTMLSVPLLIHQFPPNQVSASSSGIAKYARSNVEMRMVSRCTLNPRRECLLVPRDVESI